MAAVECMAVRVPARGRLKVWNEARERTGGYSAKAIATRREATTARRLLRQILAAL
jgi:hypothetical protein